MGGFPRYAAALVLTCGFLTAPPHIAHAKTDRHSDLPLPRFVSLKRPVANVRVGPGRRYPIRWVYKKQGLPVEVIARYGNWKRIRGHDGSDGWVHHALLSSTRTALVSPWSEDGVDLRSSPRQSASIVAKLEPNVLVHPSWCDRTWCRVSVRGHDYEGYVRQAKLWGVYPNETIAGKDVWGTISGLF